jgi:hypothetical protein
MSFLFSLTSIGVDDEKICEKWSTTKLFYQDIRSIWIDEIKNSKENKYVQMDFFFFANEILI